MMHPSTAVGATLIAVSAALCAPGQAAGQGVLSFTSDRCAQGGVPEHQYFSSGPHCRSSIWRVNEDGTDLTRLTAGAFPGREDEGRGDYDASWSPDATRIVFSRGLSQQARLVTMNADGSDQAVLLRKPMPERFETQEVPIWSRDGEIFFTAKRFGWDYTSSIFSVDPTGTVVRRLTALNELATLSGFSATGLKTLFYRVLVRQRPHDPPVETAAGTYAMNRDGSGRTLVAEGDVGQFSFYYSPDGRYVALVVAPYMQVMTARGKPVGAPMRDAYPGSWSLFGPTLFFRAPTEANLTRAALFRMSPSKPGSRVQITDGTADDRGPSWGLSGQQLPVPDIEDVAPPIATLLEPIQGDAVAASMGDGAATKRTRLPYLVVDLSGIRKVKAAVARRIGRRCRFLTGKRLGRRRSCRRRSYFVVGGPKQWAHRVRRLRHGTYEVHFKATDTKGNTTRHPRRQVVRLD
jgi:Tol biopolymer transport system component